MSHDVNRAMALEQYMISTDCWDDCPYPEAIKIVRRASEEGYSAGLAVAPDGKWYVLMCGQGPFVAWESPD